MAEDQGAGDLIDRGVGKKDRRALASSDSEAGAKDNTAVGRDRVAQNEQLQRFREWR